MESPETKQVLGLTYPGSIIPAKTRVPSIPSLCHIHYHLPRKAGTNHGYGISGTTSSSFLCLLVEFNLWKSKISPELCLDRDHHGTNPESQGTQDYPGVSPIPTVPWRCSNPTQTTRTPHTGEGVEYVLARQPQLGIEPQVPSLY